MQHTSTFAMVIYNTALHAVFAIMISHIFWPGH